MQPLGVATVAVACLLIRLRLDVVEHGVKLEQQVGDNLLNTDLYCLQNASTGSRGSQTSVVVFMLCSACLMRFLIDSMKSLLQVYICILLLITE